jgi:DNA-binding transcriptional ArsR family regulator
VSSQTSTRSEGVAGASASATPRSQLLERYGRMYGELGLAIAFTSSTTGEGAKRCGKSWNETSPLPDGDFGASLLKGRGERRNPAVVLRRSNLVGLECDTIEGLEQIQALGLPATVTVQSSKPYKLHFWFRPPNGEVRYSAFRFEKAGITADTGRYMLVPPAVHPSGAVYAFLREPPETAIATLPTDKYDKLVQLADGSSRRLRAELSNDPAAKISEGQRRETIFRFACSQRAYGVPEATILAAAKELNRARCEPPLSDEQVSHQVKGALEYEPGTVGGGHQNSFPPLGNRPGGNENVSEPYVFSATPIESLLENVPPEPEWKVRGYVATYALTLLAGRPKVGKSTLVFALLAQLVAGEPFGGLETDAAGVLLLSEERRDTLAEKARILGIVSFPPPTSPSGGNNKNRPLHVLMRHDAGAVAWPELVRQAMTYCHQHKLGVLVIDTWDRWTSLRGDSENAAGAVNEALEPLQYAAASGLAVLIVTHQRKSAGEFGDAVRGSNALVGGVDTVVELERPLASFALGAHARVLRAVSRFSSTPEELFLELDEVNNGFTVIESPEQVKAAAERMRVADVAGGGTSKEIAEEVELPEPTVRRHLKALQEAGHLERAGSGKRGDPFRWTRVAEE